MKRKLVFLLLIIVILSSIALSYEKQKYIVFKTPYDKKFFISIHGGALSPGGSLYSLDDSFTYYGETAYYGCSTKINTGGVFGGAAGFFFTDNFGFRVDFDIASTDSTSNFDAVIPNPWYFHQQKEIRFTIEELETDLNVFHGDLVFRTEMGENIMFTIGAGVSIWNGDIAGLYDFAWEWEFPSTLSLTDIEYAAYETGFVGFNGLVVIEVFLSDMISFGVEARYSEAKGDIYLPDYILDVPLKVNLGGLFALISANIYF